MVDSALANAQAGLSELDIQEAVAAALDDLDFVRESALPLRVRVEGDRVILEGVVLTRIMRRAVLEAAARVPGVQKVIDRLYTDADLQMAVSQALSADPATRDAQPNILVTSYRGDVILTALPAASAALDAAAAVAARVAGVRSVAARHARPVR